MVNSHLTADGFYAKCSSKIVETLLVSFLISHKLESPGEKYKLRNCLHLINWWAFLWSIFLNNDWCGILTHCGCCPGLGGPGLYQKASWASRGEQASKHCSSMVSISALASKFLHCIPRTSGNIWEFVLWGGWLWTKHFEPLSYSTISVEWSEEL